MSNRIKLAIGTPCYGGLGYVDYFVALMNTINLLRDMGIQCQPIFISGESLITRARNNIVAKFLTDSDMTHLLFIDSDIVWKPEDVVKLIRADKDIVGGIYPLKNYQWEKLDQKDALLEDRRDLPYNKGIKEEDLLRQNLMKYNLNLNNKSTKIEKNLMEVEHIATGFMMIRRSVLEKMIQNHPDLKFEDDVGCLNSEENKNAYSLFDCQIVNKHYYSEDWLFCHRWRELGGSVYAHLTIDLTHIGPHKFQGRFLSSLVIQ